MAAVRVSRSATLEIEFRTARDHARRLSMRVLDLNPSWNRFAQRTTSAVRPRKVRDRNAGKKNARTVCAPLRSLKSRRRERAHAAPRKKKQPHQARDGKHGSGVMQIGRASCRERV